MSQNSYLMTDGRKKSKIEIGFDEAIGNVIIVPEIQGECRGVNIVACRPSADDFRCSKNTSKSKLFGSKFMKTNDVNQVLSPLLLGHFGQTDMRSLCTHRDTSKNAIIPGIFNDERTVKTRNVQRNIAFFGPRSSEHANHDTNALT